DPVSLAVRNVTKIAVNNSGVEAVDPAYLPVLDPVTGNPVIAFASTGKTIVAGTGGFDPNTGTPGDHDLWQTQDLGPSAARPFIHLTVGPGDDREPAWNRGPSSRFFQDLAFSSRGRTGSTRNIYWIANNQLPEVPATTIVHQLLTP